MELAEFVRARLDEDEAAAKEARGGTWEAIPAGWQAAPGAVDHVIAEDIGKPDLLLVADHLTGIEAEHIARHDPARVLREVAAKRAILVRHKINAEPEIWGDRPDAPEMRGKPTGYTSYWCDECDHDRDYGHIGGREEGCPTVRILAAVWSDHPDYRAEWHA